MHIMRGTIRCMEDIHLRTELHHLGPHHRGIMEGVTLLTAPGDQRGAHPLPPTVHSLGKEERIQIPRAAKSQKQGAQRSTNRALETFYERNIRLFRTKKILTKTSILPLLPLSMIKTALLNKWLKKMLSDLREKQTVMKKTVVRLWQCRQGKRNTMPKPLFLITFRPAYLRPTSGTILRMSRPLARQRRTIALSMTAEGDEEEGAAGAEGVEEVAAEVVEVAIARIEEDVEEMEVVREVQIAQIGE
mmetsp:Transcript_15197/g.18257  ORF Transcript_15197/g.18257 Transcript_15197/m.18257 type:complete len:246 (+) Transcript_15197:487-1224(+)